MVRLCLNPNPQVNPKGVRRGWCQGSGQASQILPYKTREPFLYVLDFEHKGTDMLKQETDKH